MPARVMATILAWHTRHIGPRFRFVVALGLWLSLCVLGIVLTLIR